MKLTCLRTVCPSEVTACSAPMSGSARRTATSVIADDISFSSCARHTNVARNQKIAIGSTSVADNVSSNGVANTSQMRVALAISGTSMA